MDMVHDHGGGTSRYATADLALPLRLTVGARDVDGPASASTEGGSASCADLPFRDLSESSFCLGFFFVGAL